MRGILQFDKTMYDLDGLLGLSERVQADFLFMIQEDDEEIYYLDREENQKYDSQFSRFVRRVEDYLEDDENRGVFILFALNDGDAVRILNGKLTGTHVVDTADVELSEEIYYGLMLHCAEGMYLFKEALYIKDKGDDHVEIVQYAGDLSRLSEVFLREFE